MKISKLEGTYQNFKKIQEGTTKILKIPKTTYTHSKQRKNIHIHDMILDP